MLIIAQEFPRVKKPTFNLPALSDGRVIEGVSSSSLFGQMLAGSAPAITGTFNIANSAGTNNRLSGWIVSGAFGKTSLSYNDVCGASVGTGTNAGGKVTFNASNSSSVYWRNDDEVHAKCVRMMFCVKY